MAGTQAVDIVAKIHKLTAVQIFFVFLGVALVVFSVGLRSPFIGDDFPQIVNNAQVHSVSNIPKLFSESTFANGSTQNRLTGTGYRPLMMTVFAVLYTFFGPHPIVFHIFLLLISVISTFLLFLVFRYFVPQPLAFGLALLFLVHPINSQAVFSIPVTQDTLYFFFGILGFWLLLRFQDKSPWYLGVTALCLLFSALSKETGILFAVVSLVYMWIANRKRFYILLGFVALVLAVFMPLRLHAVGLSYSAHNSPIEDLSLGQRLLNIPELILFYVAKFVYPLHLAQAYYWAHTNITLAHFVLPLLLDIALAAGLLYLGMCIRQKSPRLFVAYLFFTSWLAIGLGAHLQISPLDMTASETWFYFPAAGVLGMFGAACTAFVPRKHWKLASYIFVGVIMLLAIRTFVRGFDWQSQTKLAYRNVAVSKEDYVSYNLIANDFLRQGDYKEAKQYASRSIAIYSFGTNYNTLAAAEFYLGQYPQARDAYINAIKYGGDDESVYQNLALLYAICDDPANAKQFYSTAVAKFPHDATIWFDVAVFANRHGYSDIAKRSIIRARDLGDTDSDAYSKIMAGEPYSISLDTVR